MADLVYVPVPVIDVLREDFSNMEALIQQTAADMDALAAAGNTWEVCFSDYDGDPREIQDIPEVVNWIRQSVEAGIPWFYFMKADPLSMGLFTFMICCGMEYDPEHCVGYAVSQSYPEGQEVPVGTVVYVEFAPKGTGTADQD